MSFGLRVTQNPKQLFTEGVIFFYFQKITLLLRYISTYFKNMLTIRVYRKIMRQRIANGIFAPFKIREISSVWDFPKDGKRYRKNLTIKDLRK